MKTKLALLALLSFSSIMPMAYLEEKAEEQEIITIVQSDSRPIPNPQEEEEEEEEELNIIFRSFM